MTSWMAVVLPFCRPLIRMAVINGESTTIYNRASRFEGEFGVMNLTWETVEKLNVGTEIGLWNALDLQVDWFKEQRRDIFMQRNNIPSAAGFPQNAVGKLW